MEKGYAGSLVIAILLISCVFAVSSVNAAAASENSWEIMTPMPTARLGPCLAVLNGKIYAIGGVTSSGVTNVNEVYDVATNNWTTVTPMLQASTGFATAVYKNKIYCFGWENVQVYDPVVDAWEMRTPSPNPRGGLSASVFNDKIYLIGGEDSYSWMGLPYVQHSTLNEMYDPATDSWTTMAPMLAEVGSSALTAVVDGKIYVFGNVAVTQIYDTQTNTWSYGPAMPAMPYSVSYGAAAATTGACAPKRIYRIGGLGEVLTQIFDPATQSWSTGAAMPTPRRFLSVAVVDDLLYVIGGENNEGSGTTLSNANERYTPLGYTSLPPKVQVVSPEQNKTYASGNVSLAFTVDRHFTELCYSMNGEANVTITGNTTLTGLSEGLHNVTVYAADPTGNIGASQTIHFTVDFPPKVSLQSPQNQTYTSTDVSLTFTVNEPVSHLSYVLDGLENVTVGGNTTLTALANGDHNVTVYATDVAGNVGVSETVSFIVALPVVPEPFPTTLVITASGASLAAAVAVLVYFKKRKP